MEKVKISKELAIATQKALESWGEEELLRSQSSREKWTLDEYLPLNEISLIKLAEILVKGYEVEQTAEEKILEYYNHCVSESKLKLRDFDKGYWEGSRHAILNILEFKKEIIKGVND